MARIDQAIEHARSRRGQTLESFRELLAIPSVSTLPEHAGDVRRTAEWLAARLKHAGMRQVELAETSGHPIVYAEWLGAEGKPVVLVYGHYDVQPVDPLDEWESDPFAPEVRGEYIYARGASDMKGQLLAFLEALDALVAQGPPPVNLKFMLEGEEEVGSPNLGAFVDGHADRLACDFVLNCDAGIQAPDVPAIVYALRGLAYFEVEVRAARKDLHSGMFGGAVANPIHVLSALVAGMHDAEGRVTLPGFYDKVRDLNRDEREVLARIPYDEDAWLEMAGARTPWGEAGYTTVERIGARPSLDVNGIWGGFTGTGAKTVLPAKAAAKLSTRLVPDQEQEDVEAQLRAYLEAHAPETVTWELRTLSLGPGAVMDRTSPYMRKAAAALEAVFGRPPLFKREGGSVPVVGLLQEKLGVDSIMLGFALPDDGIHGPNERQYLPNTYKGIETYIRFLTAL